MPLDTLKIAKQMEAAGMPRQQSEALAAVLQEENFANLVTNSDLGVAVDRLESRIEAVEQRLEAKIAALDSKIDRVEARLGGRIDAVEARLQMLQWIVGLNLAVSLGILWKLLR